MTPSPRDRIILSLLLAAFTLFAFLPVRHMDFLNVDDDRYIYRNPYMMQGLTADSFRWALTADLFSNTIYADYWQPVTFLTRLFDVECFGMNPAGHHITNLAVHTMAVVLFFLLLVRLFGSPWLSFLAAAVFAVHPLKAESVAWVTERKDVLSGLFCALTVWAYVWYTQKPSFRRNLCVTAVFALGLMSKPSLVVLPAALLLLDAGPLGRRQQNQGWRRLLLEKTGLYLLSIASFLVTFFAQTPEHQDLVWVTHIKIFAAHLGWYVFNFLWPGQLTIFYPLWEEQTSVKQAVLILAAAAAVTGWAMRQRRSQPYAFFGWLWFLIFLLPGLAQKVLAARFTYVPSLGLAVFAVFGARDLLSFLPGRKFLAPAAAGFALILCLALTRHELDYWKNSIALFERNLEVAGPNYVGYSNLGAAYVRKGEFDKAVPYIEESLRLNPSQDASNLNMGIVMAVQGHDDTAIPYYERSLRVNPLNDVAHHNLAICLKRRGRTQEAMEHFRQAIRITPANAEAHNNFGILLLEIGSKDEALAHFAEVLRLNSNFEGLHYRIANIMASKGKIAEAVTHYRRALRDQPSDLQAANNLAWILATHPDAAIRNGAEAVQFMEHALRGIVNPPAEMLDTLSAAYAAAERFGDAERAARKALNLAAEARDTVFIGEIEMRLSLYRSQKPFLSSGFSP